VDFGLKYSKSPLHIPPMHLTNYIGQREYKCVFGSYQSSTKSVTFDIDNTYHNLAIRKIC
jgi:hypothetical protein